MKIHGYEIELIEIQKTIKKHKALIEKHLKELGITLEELENSPTTLH